MLSGSPPSLIVSQKVLTERSTISLPVSPTKRVQQRSGWMPVRNRICSRRTFCSSEPRERWFSRDKPSVTVVPIAPTIDPSARRKVDMSTSALLAAAGFAVIGPSSIGQFVSYYLDWGPNSSDNLLPVQQSWLVSWPGFQISLGREPHPLITIDLILLSLAVAMFAWTRIDAASSVAVVGLMLIPLTPYAQFYDGALVLVGIALVLRTGLSTALKAGLSIGLYAAALVTQANVDFPTKDLLGSAQANGVFCLAPALVAAAAVLAIAGARRSPPEGAA